MSLAYTRKFIILKKEFSTMAGRNPKGHCKLEIKGIRGIITVNIENAEVDSFYNVAFISKDSTQLFWELGKIFTDDMGRGKGEYTFLQRELEGKSFPTDKISGILIMRDGEILLGGYLDKEDGTIERYIESIPMKTQIKSIPESTPDEIQNIEEVVEELAEIQNVQEIEEQSIEKIQEERIEEVKELIEIEEPIIQEIEVQGVETEELDPYQESQDVELIGEPVNIETIDDSIYNVPAQEPMYEAPVYNPAYDIPATEPMIELKDIGREETNPKVVFDLEELDEESMEPDYKTLDYIRKLNQKNQTTNYVLSILRFFPYIDPFKYNLKGYNWWLVELDKDNEYRAFLPYFSYIIGGNNKEPYNNNIVTCNQLMNKYGHYIFGLYNEGETVKYFLYGIPGDFTLDEHPYRGTNGFNTWYQGQHVKGYWIIYIDPMSGKPISPVIPMVPVD